MDHSWDEVGHTDNMVLYAWYGHSGLPGMAGSGIRLESSPRHESRPGGRIMTLPRHVCRRGSKELALIVARFDWRRKPKKPNKKATGSWLNPELVKLNPVRRISGRHSHRASRYIHEAYAHR